LLFPSPSSSSSLLSLSLSLPLLEESPACVLLRFSLSLSMLSLLLLLSILVTSESFSGLAFGPTPPFDLFRLTVEVLRVRLSPARGSSGGVVALFFLTTGFPFTALFFGLATAGLTSFPLADVGED
jgi:hypothetical protein